jgi:hypothetical protein
MTENKMAEVARLFGKKLDKRFTFVYHGGTYDAKFTTAGLWVFYDFIDFDEAYEALMLKELLTGEAVIVDE